MCYKLKSFVGFLNSSPLCDFSFVVQAFLLLFQPIDSLLVGVLYKDLHELLQLNPSNNDAPKHNK